MRGYGFGPGGYGRTLLDRFRTQYHKGKAKSSGSARDMAESFHMRVQRRDRVRWFTLWPAAYVSPFRHVFNSPSAAPVTIGYIEYTQSRVRNVITVLTVAM